MTRPIWAWNRAGLKKKQEKKNPGVTWRPSKTRSKTRLQPVDFCFDDVILIFFKN
jgi:hypothetical protein